MLNNVFKPAGILSGLLATVLLTGTAFRLMGDPAAAPDGAPAAAAVSDAELSTTQDKSTAPQPVALPAAWTKLPGMPAARPYRMALEGHARLMAKGLLDNPRYLTLVDFSLPSTEKRMWVMDLDAQEVVFHTYAAHGVASGGTMATAFSDIPQSHQSSLGFYLAAEAYTGKHGLSLRLDGMEPGINGHARERAIVLHGADYAEAQFIRNNGRLGRSQGCPSVPRALSTPIIEAIKGNSCLFVYAENSDYFSQTALLSDWEDVDGALASL